MALFLRLQPSEQAHSLRLFRQLLDRGETDVELLAAALLHDVGKSRYPLRVWERILIVLAKALFPHLVKHWGQAQPYGWRRLFVISEMHAAWGADMAAMAGAPAMTVSLIRRHQDILPTHPESIEERYLQILQSLDNEN
jgi:hypothetical protein